MIGIYDCFGYGSGYDVPFDERYRQIKQAGFDCVMFWWSDKFGRGDPSQNTLIQSEAFAIAVAGAAEGVHT